MARDASAYAGREQALVKHYLLETYLDRLVHKVARSYDQIVYVDGYSGPWLSSGQSFEDTSFGIALSALRKAKASWAALGRTPRMVAHLVERDAKAYQKLATVPERFPDIEVHTHFGDFRALAAEISRRIPNAAFSFVLIDPKGWRIDLNQIEPLIARPNAEVLFNFMFEFVNRAASMSDPLTVSGLDQLIPYGAWRDALPNATTPDQRKRIIVDAFAESLSKVGGYEFVAETPILRPVRDRVLYSLVYGTRKPIGLQVFRDTQVKALREQAKIRGAAKVRAASEKSNQSELFDSFVDMAPDESLASLEGELGQAEATILQLLPTSPEAISYGTLWPKVLSRHVVRETEVASIVAAMRRDGRVLIQDWGPRVRRPQGSYLLARPA